MQKFTTLRGVAAPLPMINIDTDMIIPKQFLKTIKRTGPRQEPVRRAALRDGRQGEARFRAEPAGLSQGADPGGRGEFRLRLEPRACALGAAGFRHPLRHRHELRRHLLQQLLQERHPADQAAPVRGRQADGGCPARLQRHRHHRSREAGDHRPRRRACPFRGRSLPQALPAERPRRYRPHLGEGRVTSTASRRATAWPAPGCGRDPLELRLVASRRFPSGSASGDDGTGSLPTFERRSHGCQ